MKFTLALMMLCVAACGSAPPTSAQNHLPRSCTSNVHCNADEVCFSYPVGGSFWPGDRGWREGRCEKLEATK